MLRVTLSEINKIFASENISFLVTRFGSNNTSAGDLDILVKPRDFHKVIKAFEQKGYAKKSHDQALSGRISGAQVNLIKLKRIKIDLHKDFTWRKSRYFDLGLLWKNSLRKNIRGVVVGTPKTDWDAFLVLINIIFEKTYITKEEYNVFWKNRKAVFSNKDFRKQAIKHGWEKTFLAFEDWTNNTNYISTFPKFLPVSIIVCSYFEKFHLVSILYYLFFRLRHLVNNKLPYD